MTRILFLVGLGSFVGGIARYLSQLYMQKNFPSVIPLGTLGVNVLGCLLIGVIYGLATRGNVLSAEMRLLLATGFCGGFTTFSAFAHENFELMENRGIAYALAYIAMSVVLGIAAVYLGFFLVKQL